MTCDFPSCSAVATECHAGEVMLCAEHYRQAARAVHYGVEVTEWLQWRPFVMVKQQWQALGQFDSEDAALASLTPRPDGARAWLIKRPGEA